MNEAHSESVRGSVIGGLTLAMTKYVQPTSRIAACRFRGVDRRRTDGNHDFAVSSLQHLLLASEIVTDQASGNAGASGNLANRCSLEPIFGNTVERGGDQVLPAFCLPCAMEGPAAHGADPSGVSLPRPGNLPNFRKPNFCML